MIFWSIYAPALNTKKVNYLFSILNLTIDGKNVKRFVDMSLVVLDMPLHRFMIYYSSMGMQFKVTTLACIFLSRSNSIYHHQYGIKKNVIHWSICAVGMFMQTLLYKSLYNNDPVDRNMCRDPIIIRRRFIKVVLCEGEDDHVFFGNEVANHRSRKPLVLRFSWNSMNYHSSYVLLSTHTKKNFHLLTQLQVNAGKYATSWD